MSAMYIAILSVEATGINRYLAIFITVPVLFAFGYFLWKGPFNTLFTRGIIREPISILMFEASITYIIKSVMGFFFTTNAQAATTNVPFQLWKRVSSSSISYY